MASILELPESAVPDFGGDHEWLSGVAKFLEPFGLAYVQVKPDDAALRGMFAFGRLFHTIEGMSFRGRMHAIVGLNGQPFWDPHPEDGTLHGLKTTTNFGLLVSRGTTSSRERVHRALDYALSRSRLRRSA